MREGDKDGAWGLVKDGMRYATHLRVILILLIHPSTAVIYEHVPWLGYYTRNFPSLITNLIKLRHMAANRTTQRYNSGSKVKDLFYYLVREMIGHTYRFTHVGIRVTRIMRRRSLHHAL